jgi:RNA polymerase sigma factor (sigma-70 family)
LVSSRRRAWIGERPTEELPEAVGNDPVEEIVVDRHLFWPLVCALPARQRAVIVLRYYEDLTEAQIAEVLGCAPGTVKSQSSAAIGSLRRALAASGIGEAMGES